MGAGRNAGRPGPFRRYITDAQGGLFDQADAVLVGADALLADGTLVNKAGTYLLALAAKDQNVPFWVCAESFKCTTTPADAFALEERSGSGATRRSRAQGRNPL